MYKKEIGNKCSELGIIFTEIGIILKKNSFCDINSDSTNIVEAVVINDDENSIETKNENLKVDEINLNLEPLEQNHINENNCEQNDIENKYFKKFKKEIINNMTNKGSITKRTDGRYMGRYRDICVYARTKQECRIKLNLKIDELIEEEKNNNIFSKTVSLNRWIENWYTKYKAPTLKGSTQTYYKNALNEILNSKISQLKISSITPEHIEKLYDNINGLVAKKNGRVILNEAFKMAHDCGIIKINPMAIVILSGPQFNASRNEQPKEKHLLTDDEVNAIFNFKSKYTNIFKIIYFTGMRVGEARALKWGDFTNDTVEIKRAFNVATKQIDTPKSKKSYRKIPLTKKAQEFIYNELKLRAPDFDNPKAFVFPDQVESHASPSVAFGYICKKLNIDASIHSLRHKFASDCYSKGVDIKVIQEWLGHDSYATTLDIYTHLDNKTKRKQAELLEDEIDE